MLIDGVECTADGEPVDGFKPGDIVQISGFMGSTFIRGVYRPSCARPIFRLVSRPRKLVEGWFVKQNNCGFWGPCDTLTKAINMSATSESVIYLRECDPPEAKDA